MQIFEPIQLRYFIMGSSSQIQKATSNYIKGWVASLGHPRGNDILQAIILINDSPFILINKFIHYFSLQTLNFVEDNLLYLRVGHLIGHLYVFAFGLMKAYVVLQDRLLAHGAVSKDNWYFFFGGDCLRIVEADGYFGVVASFDGEEVLYYWLRDFSYDVVFGEGLEVYLFFGSVAYLPAHSRTVYMKTTLSEAQVSLSLQDLTARYNLVAILLEV